MSQESDRSDQDDLTVFNMYGTCMLLRASCLTLEIKFTDVKIEESEKAVSPRELKLGHLWLN